MSAKMPKPVLNAKIRAQLALATQRHYADQLVEYVRSNREQLHKPIVRRHIKFFAERYEAASVEYGKRLGLLARAMKRAGVA
jgi:hypothetical protein